MLKRLSFRFVSVITTVSLLVSSFAIQGNSIALAASSDDNLSALTLSSGTLSPSFAAGTQSYTASVPYSVTSVNVQPTVEDSTATLKINNQAVTSGQSTPVSLNVGSNTIDVVVTAEDGTPKTYTVTVMRQAASTNADLGNLTLSAGTLSPSFASGTYSYTADVDNATTSVDVTPTVADGTATVTVNGNAVTSGQAKTVYLNTGANTITVVVKAQDGTTQDTYTITVNRAKSSNNNLSSLTLSSGTLTPSFAAGTQSYTASVPYSVSSMNVTPTVADTTASVTVGGNSATSGQAAPVSLNVGSNTIDVVVTAEDGTPKTYTVTVMRQAASTNADLGNLTLSAGTLSPSFASGTYSYTADVDNATTSVDVTPTVADGTATVTVNGNPVTSGNVATVNLNVGSNTITVVVTAQDGTTEENYTVTVIRAASSDADLSNLTLSQGTLSPTFASGTTSYLADVPNSATTVDVTPTVSDSTATVTVNGQVLPSGTTTPVQLAVGLNTITVVVTAQNGTTEKTYTVTVNRMPSSIATLSGLSLNQGTLSPTFDSGTNIYTDSVAYSVNSVDVTPVVTDSTATITVNGNPVSSDQATNVNLAVSNNTITVVVTAQDGTTKQTYTITVNRAAPSVDADLAKLTLSQGTLSPAFTSGTTSYNADVATVVNSVYVTPTVSDSTAAVTVNGTPVASGSGATVPLNVGPNNIAVQVAAQDGATKQTYTVTVTRAAPSANAELSALTLSDGILSPAFAPGTTSYTVSVTNVASSVYVTPTVTDSTSTVTINGTAVAAGSGLTVPLTVGANAITVVVTAQDGTQKAYTVTVTRSASAPPVQTPPTYAPFGLSHSAVTTTSWTESWPSVPGATSYNVYVDGAKVASVTGTSTVITGQQPGTTYSVTVSTVNGVGVESQHSPADVVTTAKPLTYQGGTEFTTWMGDTYQLSLTLTGGSGPYTSSVVSGSLPNGLNLDATTGLITGRPKESGVYTFTVQATDTTGAKVSETLTLTVLHRAERQISFNGNSIVVPTVVKDDAGTPTTYVPIWYLMQMLKPLGISSQWNGQKWTLQTDLPVNLTDVQPGHGTMGIYLNATLVQAVTGLHDVDPNSGKLTTYMPIWYLMQLLKQMHLQSAWDGMKWAITMESNNQSN